jgi:hypothetical protein
MKKPQIKKVKPFKPLGNRVVSGSLANNYIAKNRPATDAEIINVVKLDKMLKDLRERKALQEAKWRQEKYFRMFLDEVRRADLS